MAAWIILISFLLAVCEITLHIVGLGNPVLYELAPEFGYRPLPNQSVHRFRGAVVRINNLGLRALRDWDSTTSNKILFLGNSVTYGGSYVTTADLFSERAMPAGSSWIPGNGGVNAWGVDNIHGLIVRRGFQPAQVYVTVLIEGDFYRGLSEMPSAYCTTQPPLAITEGIAHVWEQIAALLQLETPVEERPGGPARAESAVKHLKEIDDLLRANGRVHLMYLSPVLANLIKQAPRDTLLSRLFTTYGLRIAPLQDRPELQSMSIDSIRGLYHDGVHLSPRGHEVWAMMLRADLTRLLGGR